MGDLEVILINFWITIYTVSYSPFWWVQTLMMEMSNSLKCIHNEWILKKSTLWLKILFVYIICLGSSCPGSSSMCSSIFWRTFEALFQLLSCLSSHLKLFTPIAEIYLFMFSVIVIKVSAGHCTATCIGNCGFRV